MLVIMLAKPYESKAWLSYQLHALHKTPVEIAKACNVNQVTIYRWINKFGLKT